MTVAFLDVDLVQNSVTTAEFDAEAERQDGIADWSTVAEDDPHPAERRRLLGLPLVYGNPRGVRHEEVTWSQLVSIWQVIGRLVRGGSPARVHFCDARFAERSAHHQEGETPYTSLLVGMREVLAPYFEQRPFTSIDPRDLAVARLLYEPLFRALDRIEGVADVARV